MADMPNLDSPRKPESFVNSLTKSKFWPIYAVAIVCAVVLISVISIFVSWKTISLALFGIVLGGLAIAGKKRGYEIF